MRAIALLVLGVAAVALALPSKTAPRAATDRPNIVMVRYHTPPNRTTCHICTCTHTCALTLSLHTHACTRTLPLSHARTRAHARTSTQRSRTSDSPHTTRPSHALPLPSPSAHVQHIHCLWVHSIRPPPRWQRRPPHSHPILLPTILCSAPLRTLDPFAYHPLLRSAPHTPRHSSSSTTSATATRGSTGTPRRRHRTSTRSRTTARCSRRGTPGAPCAPDRARP